MLLSSYANKDVEVFLGTISVLSCMAARQIQALSVGCGPLFMVEDGDSGFLILPYFMVTLFLLLVNQHLIRL